MSHAFPVPLSSLVLAGAAALALSGCAAQTSAVPDVPAAAPAAAVANSPELAALFAADDAAELALSPEWKAYRGIRDADYGKWTDHTSVGRDASFALHQETAAKLRAQFDPAKLSPQDALSYRLYEYRVRQELAARPYRDYAYPFEQMSGLQSEPASFLINTHSIADVAQAEAYIDRIEGIAAMFAPAVAESARNAEKGLMPPKWVYDRVVSDIDNQIAAKGPDFAGNAIIDDFAAKIAAIDITDAQRADLMARARKAWGESARPAFVALRAEMLRQKAMAGTDDGIWHVPGGDAYYDVKLAEYTTTDLNADQIHQLGLEQVARIHAEMEAIKDKVGFKGTLKDFFAYTRDDPRFYYTTREAYLADTQKLIDAMEAELPKWFGILPKDALKVKPVEPFREAVAGKAFYQGPAEDGSRPGTYYVNLYNLKAMSANEMEALVYHEGLPGHHMQISIQTGLTGLPAFRRFGGYTAYSEGWGLYSEALAKDMGFYTNPYQDFGRLQLELWRAARLVVDTGIHRKRWSVEDAVAYLLAETPNPEPDIRREVERYVVYPGQATAYMIGKMKILELREKARAELGDRFDVRAFHDEVLKSGSVPLGILEENVDAWIARQKG